MLLQRWRINSSIWIKKYVEILVQRFLQPLFGQDQVIIIVDEFRALVGYGEEYGKNLDLLIAQLQDLIEFDWPLANPIPKSISTFP